MKPILLSGFCLLAAPPFLQEKIVPAAAERNGDNKVPSNLFVMFSVEHEYNGAMV